MEQMWTQFLVNPLIQLVGQLQGYLGNFGPAIITLAVLARVALFPLTLAQLNYNRRSLALAPQIERLKKTWANDATRLNQETLALYQQAGVNPTLGCLAPTARLGIEVCLWFGVYQVTRAVPAARASFLWLPNLAEPNGLPLPSPFLNYLLLAVLLVAVHILYQFTSDHLAVSASPSFFGSSIVWLIQGITALLAPAGLVFFWVASSLCDLFVLLWATAPTSTSRIAKYSMGLFALAALAVGSLRVYQATGSIWLAAYVGLALAATVFAYIGGGLFGTHRRAQIVYYLIPQASLYLALYWMVQRQAPAWQVAAAAAGAAWFVATLYGAFMGRIAPRFSLQARLGAAVWVWSAAAAEPLRNQLWRFDLDKLKQAVEQGEQVVSSQPALAMKRFTDVVETLRSVAAPSDEEKDYLTRAYYGLGQLTEGANETTAAIEHYTQAYHLGSAPALMSLASLLARLGKTDDVAFNIYIDYLTARRAGAHSPGDEAILGIVESMCQVKLGDKSTVIQASIHRARAVLQADPNIEWAAHYLGIGLLELGQLDAAQSALEDARRRNPKRAATHLGLGLVYLRRGQPEQARAPLETSLGLDPAQPEVAYQLGALLLAPLLAGSIEPSSVDGQARLEAALTWLQRATQLDSRQARFLYALGQATLLAGDYVRAAGALEQAGQLDPHHKETHYYLGVAYQALDQQPKAQRAFQRAIELDPNYGPAQRDLGALLFRGRHYAEAADHYRLALQAESHDLVARCGLGRSLYELGAYQDAAEQLLQVASASPEALFYLARAQLRLQQFDLAIANLEQLVGLDSRHVDALYYLGCAYAHAGAAGRAGAYAGAIAAFERCSEMQPDRWQAYLQMGNVFLKQDDAPNAQRCYLQAQVYQPRDGEVLYALGQVAYQNNDLTRARTLFEQAVSHTPNSMRVYRALGIVCEQLGETTQALDAYQRANAYPLLGALLCRQGDYPGAVSNLQAAVAAGDESDMILNYLGFALAQVREYDAALAAWSKLKDRQPDDPRLALNMVRLQYVRGREQALAGRYAEAAEAWEVYLKAYSGDDEVQRDLAAIYVKLGGKRLNGHLNARGNAASSDAALTRTAFQRALVLQPGLADAEYGLALLDLIAGDDQASAARLRGLIDTVPYASEYKYHLALALLQQDQAAEALPLLQQVIVSSSDTNIIRRAEWATAAVYARDGQWECAARLFGETV